MNVSKGSLFFAVVDATDDEALVGKHANAALARIQPNGGLDISARLGDVYDRIGQALRASGPDAVAILATRKNNQWAYGQAFERVSIIATVLLATHHLQVPCSEVKTDAVSKVVGVPATSLEKTPWATFGFSAQPTYWTTGLSEAYAATAVALAQEKANG